MDRQLTLDFVRVSAMLGVIAIHVTSGYIYAESRMTFLGINPALFLNQLVRFAVPMFILLSGAALGLSQRARTAAPQPENERKSSLKEAASFYRHRFCKLGIPFLAWSLLYVLYDTRFDLLGTITAPGFLKTWLLGQSASHLYFPLILLQLYLLYPLLARWQNCSLMSLLLTGFFVTHLVQKLYTFQALGLNLIPSWLQSYLWFLFPTWLFYFTLGMALTPSRLSRLRACLTGAARATLVLVTTAVAVLYVVEAKLTGNLDSIKPLLNLYVPLVLLSLMSLWPLLERWSWFRTGVVFLSRHSMTVYFSHLLVLRLLQSLPVFRGGVWRMGLLYVAVLACSLLVAVILDGTVSRLRRAFCS